MSRKQRRRIGKSRARPRRQRALSDAARRDFNSALALYRARRFAEAETACRRALTDQPNHVITLSLLGSVLAGAGRTGDAVASFRKAIEAQPNNADAHTSLGNVLCAQGETAAGIASYEQALRYDPKSAITHHNLGLVLQNKGRLSEAVASYKRALKIEPAYDAAENNLGAAYHAQGRLDEAVAAYRRVIARNPAHAQAYNNLGDTLRAQGELDEAEAVCKKAIELDPGLAQAHYNLGRVLQAKGALGQAIASYEQSVTVDPEYVEAQCMLSLALEEMGKPAESLAGYQRALAIDPECAAAKNNIAIANRFQGRPEEEIAHGRRLLESNPDDTNARVDLGFGLWRSGAVADAVDELRKAIDISPGNATAHCTLGLALDSLGVRDDALACVRRALELEPGDVHALAAEASLLAAGADRKHGTNAKHVAIHMQQNFHYGILRQVFDAVAPYHHALLTPHIEAVVGFDPDIVVIAESHAALLRALLPRALMVWVRHGLISKNTTCYAARVSDFACLTSPVSRDWYVRHGGRPRRDFWITGYVQMDPLFRGDPLPTGLKMPADHKTVLYAPTWNAELSSAPMLGDRLVELIRGRRDDVSIVIKPHPVIADHHPQWFAVWRALAETDVDVHLVEDPAANVMSYLRLADLLVTDASSVIFEYLAVDRPMVLITNPAHTMSSHFDPQGIEWRWRDAGEEVHDVEKLAGAVDRGLTDSRLGGERRAHYREQLFGDLTDGRAAERIAEHISALEL